MKFGAKASIPKKSIMKFLNSIISIQNDNPEIEISILPTGCHDREVGFLIYITENNFRNEGKPNDPYYQGDAIITVESCLNFDGIEFDADFQPI